MRVATLIRVTWILTFLAVGPNSFSSTRTHVLAMAGGVIEPVAADRVELPAFEQWSADTSRSSSAAAAFDVTGEVVDFVGRPVVGARVIADPVTTSIFGLAALLHVDGVTEPEPRSTAVSGTDGRFLLRGMTSGSVTCSPSS